MIMLGDVKCKQSSVFWFCNGQLRICVCKMCIKEKEDVRNVTKSLNYYKVLTAKKFTPRPLRGVLCTIIGERHHSLPKTIGDRWSCMTLRNAQHVRAMEKGSWIESQYGKVFAAKAKWYKIPCIACQQQPIHLLARHAASFGW